LRKFPLSRHLLSEIVIVKVEIVVIDAEGLFAVGADPGLGCEVGWRRGVGGIVAFEAMGFGHSGAA
jgi:hypothetical protein